MSSKKPRIGINGFGRIGRAIFRNNEIKAFFDVVVINDINRDNANIAYTLNYDTLYDRLENPYIAEGDSLVSKSGNKSIKLYHEPDINGVPWEKHDLDYIIDSSGVYQNVINARKVLERDVVKKVFITHSPDKVDFSMVLGANEENLNVDKHDLISTSICDATAIAPVMRLVAENFGVENGYVTTLHPWLNYQNLMDGPASSWAVPGEIYHHFALGRSSIGNMIPKPTSAIDATFKVLGGLDLAKEKIGSFSYRTPTAIVGSADITLNLKKSTRIQDVRDAMDAYQANQKWDVLENMDDPLVSLDFKKSPYSAVVDHRWTDVIGGSLLKLVLWYDNEWGYSGRVLDQVLHVHKQLK